MNIIKKRSESRELKILRSLHLRTNISSKETNYYFSLEKGYEGELAFDVWLKSLPKDWLIIEDLILETNRSEFQIDTLIIAPHTIYLFEVKNYKGDYYIDGDNWFSNADTDIQNPLLQLKRSEFLLRSTLRNSGLKHPIKPLLVFVNPEFYLYKAPRHTPIIFPTQINRLLRQLDATHGNVTSNHMKLAEYLLSNRLKESSYTKIPSYTYEQLKKGMYCATCYSFNISIEKTTILCNKCGGKEKGDKAVLRGIEEYKLLFPDRKLSINALQEWNQIIKSKHTLRRLLSKTFKLKRHGTSSYYI